MNRIKKSQTLISLGLFSLAIGNIAAWVMHHNAAGPFWTDFGDFVMGLGAGLSITLIFFGFRMKNRAAC